MRSRSLHYKGKSDLLSWVNNVLGLSLSQLEELSTGAVFCQLLDAYFDDVINMAKVNYLAADQFESLKNFKVLQSAFNELAIPKDVNINKLSQGRQSELLEFLQYLYKYLQGRHLAPGYDPVERRTQSKYGGTDKIPLTSMHQLEHNFKFYTKHEDQTFSKFQYSYSGAGESADNTVSHRTSSREWLSEQYGSRPVSARSFRYSSTSGSKAISGRKKTHSVREPGEMTSPTSQRSSHGGAYARSRRRYSIDSPDNVGPEPANVVPGQAVGTAVDAAGQSVKVLVKYIPLLRKMLDTVGNKDQDSYAARGRVRSMQDVMATLLRHTDLLLSDLHSVAESHPDSGVQQQSRKVLMLQQELQLSESEFRDLRDMLARLEGSSPLQPPTGGAPVTREDAPDTKQLDAVLKAIGAAHASLQPFQAETGPNLADLQTGPDGKPSGKNRAYKFGEYQIRKLKNGDIYKGKYMTGKKNGEGVYAFLNGDVYEGHFKEDQMEGHGVYTFAHQGRYEGQWCAAVYDGSGMETFAKGSTYHGEYSKGMRHGYGVCRYFNGDYYEGQWAQGLREGKGMQQCTDDSNYVGDYLKGRRHGFGVYSFPNNDQYLGEYEKDIPHGYGVYVFASGQKYEGLWVEGRKHGWCEYTVETSERYAGYWEAGQPKWVQSFNDLNDSKQTLSEEMKTKIQNSKDAAARARQAAKKGSDRAEQHWNSPGDMQQKIRQVVEQSQAAAIQAQNSRQKALEIAAKLDGMAEEHLTMAAVDK